ncbi:MAG: DUF3727 domain-containing protein [Cyanophyceae cyanobacterium]
MSSSPFSEEYEYDSEIVTLFDDEGRSLDCYIENSLDTDDATYLLLLPIDSPVVILAWEDEEEKSETIMIEDRDEIQRIFPDAKAVLAEQELTLKPTAFTLTASGELPPLEDEHILTLELDEGDAQLDTEELQYLASFYHQEQKYALYTPLAPLIFVARSNESGKLELLSPDEQQVEQILEELLFEELE